MEERELQLRREKGKYLYKQEEEAMAALASEQSTPDRSMSAISANLDFWKYVPLRIPFANRSAIVQSSASHPPWQTFFFNSPDQLLLGCVCSCTVVA